MPKKKDKTVVYLDTSVFAGHILKNDDEDKECVKLIRNITKDKYCNFEFVTSIFTLVEFGELISRKKTKNKAKITLFDLIQNPDFKITFASPEMPHKRWNGKEYFDIDLLIRNILNTALEFCIPGFDTIHAHTVKNLVRNVIVVSKDRHFKKFQKIKNVKEVLKPSDFLKNYKP